ncbi:NAD+ diphosphatase [Anaerotaenia torta]|uniref:NAD(+) diphosphatase n=1 Tax=Anaerotaenia torta TaxID=433293 RepID=UPI003D1F29DE
MISIQGKIFQPAFRPELQTEKPDWALILHERKLAMLPGDGGFRIPEKQFAQECFALTAGMIYIGSYDGHNCYCTQIPELVEASGLEYVDMREVTDKSGDPGLFIAAGTAHHILHWSSMNQYCGRCGHKTQDKENERAKICPSCHNIIYPRISPATITAVFKGDQILLAHNKKFKQNLYSLIAGFVEPGENLEHCVAREIEEEVGIKVKNIRYFGSQPWPFPDALMLAFTAEYDSGEIHEDQEEILDAKWFHASNLPDIPATDSVAGKMIRWYCSQGLKD